MDDGVLQCRFLDSRSDHTSGLMNVKNHSNESGRVLILTFVMADAEFVGMFLDLGFDGFLPGGEFASFLMRRRAATQMNEDHGRDEKNSFHRDISSYIAIESNGPK